MSSAIALEFAIINSAAIWFGSAVFAWLAGDFFLALGTPWWARALIYSAPGVALGMWSYAAFDATDQSLATWAAFFVFVAMGVYALLWTTLGIMVREFIRRRRSVAERRGT